MNDAFIFLGSNINRERNYPDAVRRVAALGTLLAVSPVYETVPVGSAPDAPPFYNGALWLHTPLKPHDLRLSLRQIENRMGRVREGDPNAPRTIDLDLVLYNEDVINDGELEIPDPLIFERGFMAQALADVNPDYVIPPDGPTLAELAIQFRSTGELQPVPTISAQMQPLVESPPPENASMSDTDELAVLPSNNLTFNPRTGRPLDRERTMYDRRAKQEIEEKRRAIAEAVRSILIHVDEDPTREGLLRTPERVARAYEELLAGYHIDPVALVNGACFEADYHEMVLVKDIEFASLCEHHMLPFFGKVHVAYIPKGRVLGLSKIPRIVDMYSRRLQLQERMTQEIATFLDDLLHPRGVAVIVTGQHMCSMMRGVRKVNSKMVTQAMLGDFENKEVREQLNDRLRQDD